MATARTVDEPLEKCCSVECLQSWKETYSSCGYESPSRKWKRAAAAEAKTIRNAKKLVMAINKWKATAEEKTAKKTYIAAPLPAELEAYRIEETQAKRIAKATSDLVKRSKAEALECAELMIAAINDIDEDNEEDNSMDAESENEQDPDE